MEFYFAIIPPIEIIDEATIEIDGNLSSIIKSISIDKKSVKIEVSDAIESNVDKKIYEVIKWNYLPHVHEMCGPENLPLELLPICSIDFLELLSSEFKFDVILVNNPKIGNYFDFYVGLCLPFAVRRANKTIFRHISKLETIYPDLLSSLMAHSDDYDDFMNNALYTFRDNILNPTLQTIQEIPIHKESDEEWQTKSVPIVYEDLIKIITQTDWLVQIMESQFNNVKERYRSLMRLVLPVIQRERLNDTLQKYVTLEITSTGINLKVIKKEIMDSKKVGETLIEHLKRVYD